METTLMFAEIVFYFTVSLTGLALGVLCAMVTYRLIRIARELEALSRNLNHASSEAGERIHDIIDRLSDVPVLSYFLKNPRHARTRKVEKGQAKQ